VTSLDTFTVPRPGDEVGDATTRYLLYGLLPGWFVPVLVCCAAGRQARDCLLSRVSLWFVSFFWLRVIVCVDLFRGSSCGKAESECFGQEARPWEPVVAGSRV
jgi:hypothetical protein